MSFSRPNLHASAALRRHSDAWFTQARENLFLKCVALFTAIVLYVYVEAEHNPNPQVTVGLQAELKCIHAPDNVKWDPPLFPVKVTGPRILVESLKDGDIHAEVDLAGLDLATGRTPPLVPKYSFPMLKPEASDRIHVDSPNTMRVQLSVYESKSEQVHVPLRNPPAGMHYERATVSPDRVTCTGIQSAVNSISRVVVNIETGADGQVHGEFPVVALDKDDQQIKDLTIVPDHARVSVPLVQDPPMHIAVVSPVVSTLPLPPYRIESITVEPPRVKIVGRPGKADPVTTVPTEEITLRNATADADLDVGLVVPPDVAVYDLQGKPLTRVHVRVTLSKGALPATNSSPSPDPTSPSGDGGTGQ